MKPEQKTEAVILFPQAADDFTIIFNYCLELLHYAAITRTHGRKIYAFV
jgi:hypothetical protein